MASRSTLLARKLKAFRATGGRHGKLTQDDLAERLGVSVDAIGKYERGVSFPRGDLQARFMDQLGWSAEDMEAARSDWDLIQRGQTGAGYSFVDMTKPDTDGKPIAYRVLDHVKEAFSDVPSTFDGDPEIWAPILQRFPGNGAVIAKGPEIVAQWCLYFLSEKDEARFRDCSFLESDLSADSLRRPLLPGQYFGYCPAVIVSPGHEAAAPMMLSSFVAFLEDLIRRDIFLSGIGAANTSHEGYQFCQDLGFDVLGPHKRYPEIQMCVLPPKGIGKGIFAQRSPLIRRAYAPPA